MHSICKWIPNYYLCLIYNFLTINLQKKCLRWKVLNRSFCPLLAKFTLFCMAVWHKLYKIWISPWILNQNHKTKPIYCFQGLSISINMIHIPFTKATIEPYQPTNLNLSSIVVVRIDIPDAIPQNQYLSRD